MNIKFEHVSIIDKRISLLARAAVKIFNFVGQSADEKVHFCCFEINNDTKQRVTPRHVFIDIKPIRACMTGKTIGSFARIVRVMFNFFCWFVTFGSLYRY